MAYVFDIRELLSKVESKIAELQEGGLHYDREVTIAEANTRKSTNWITRDCTISELFERLSHPVRTEESLDDFLRWYSYPEGSPEKEKADSLKDVGGFVGGALEGERRKNGAVLYRDLITLDMDSIESSAMTILDACEALGCCYCLYTTRRHTPDNPRMRIIIPLDAHVRPEFYEPIARRLADRIGIAAADKSTFEAARMMYWSSCSADGEYIFWYEDRPLACVEELLATYTDPLNKVEWPLLPGETTNELQVFTSEKDGTRKSPCDIPGIVGDFCRAYPIPEAIAELLPDVYIQNGHGRYKYAGASSTAGGVVVKDIKGEPTYFYSHHSNSDPASDGHLKNAFDLVRVHKFGELDATVDRTKVFGRNLPSYKAMLDMIHADPNISARMRTAQDQNTHDAVFENFGATAGNGDWLQKLERYDKSGKIAATIDNVCIILANDPLLAGCLGKNEFADREEVLREPVWETHGGENTVYPRRWVDADRDGVYRYVEKYYGISKTAKIDSAINLVMQENRYHPVRNFLDGLVWDGVKRLDEVFIRYLGAEDDADGYTRAVTGKIFIAAVRRIYEPGCKFDQMVILCGKQGIGKSRLLRKMCVYDDWFTDGIKTFEGKEAEEVVKGKWIIEVGELEAFKKSENARIKQFLSTQIDTYRASYRRDAEDFKRQCVFFGTSNQLDFLTDTTGNRRFWPVRVGLQPHDDPDTLTRDDVFQMWAEAKRRYSMGESLYLPELEELAAKKCDSYMVESPLRGIIIDFLERPVPKDWESKTIRERKSYWGGFVLVGVDQCGHPQMKPRSDVYPEDKLVPRDRVCILEVWCELLNHELGDKMTEAERKEIDKCLQTAPGWEKSQKRMRFGDYGIQRMAYVRGNSKL